MMNKLVSKYLDNCIKITDIGLPLITIFDIDVFEDIIDIFDIKTNYTDSYNWIANKYGPICFFKTPSHNMIYHNGTWRYTLPNFKIINEEQLDSHTDDGYMVEMLIDNDCIIISK